MTDKHITVDSIRWHSVLPWLQLLRIPQLAFRVRVVVLATLEIGRASCRERVYSSV